MECFNALVPYCNVETASLELSPASKHVSSSGFYRPNGLLSLCVGCGSAIDDQFYFRVQPDMEWHAGCLRCVQCKEELGAHKSCFVRDGKTYCQEHYTQLFLTFCSACSELIHSRELVYRYRECTFHCACLKCSSCHKVLKPGDQFSLLGSRLFCMEHYVKEVLHQHQTTLEPSEDDTDTRGHRKNGAINNKSGEETRTKKRSRPPQSGATSSQSGDPGSSESALHFQQQQLLTKALEAYRQLQDDGERTVEHEPEDSIPTGSVADSPSVSEADENAAQSQDDSTSEVASSTAEGTHAKHSSTATSRNGNLATDAGSCNPSSKTVHPLAASSSSSTSLLPPSAHRRFQPQHHPIGSGGSRRSREQKTTRVRTVLNDKQLHTLKACYSANPRPDALMKEQLVEMTGLSPRVIRVWYQNKRCKDKKRQILIKQLSDQQQQQHVLHPGRAPLSGVSLVASSPMMNDAAFVCPGNSLDVQQFAVAAAAAGYFGGDPSLAEYPSLARGSYPGGEAAYFGPPVPISEAAFLSGDYYDGGHPPGAAPGHMSTMLLGQHEPPGSDGSMPPSGLGGESEQSFVPLYSSLLMTDSVASLAFRDE